METKIRVGIIGCGNIFPAYVKGCRAFKMLEIAACADLLVERAEARAKEFDIPKFSSVEALLSDPEIDVVVNLTVPVVPRGGQPGGDCRREAHLQRKAAGDHPRGRQGDPRYGAAAGRARRLRAGYFSRRRLANVSQADRRRRDRRAGGGDGVHGVAWTGGVASEPGFLLQGWRRSAVRHGTLLSDGAGPSAGSGAARDRIDADFVCRTHRHQSGAERTPDRGRSADARRRACSTSPAGRWRR